MTRETFSRTLSSLSFQGVSTHGRRLRVADVEGSRERFPSDPFIDGAETVAPPLLSLAKSEGKRDALSIPQSIASTSPAARTAQAYRNWMGAMLS